MENKQIKLEYRRHLLDLLNDFIQNGTKDKILEKK
ncbi:hypothetical protein IGJ18_002846 [Enterococcus sp. AZ078]